MHPLHAIFTLQLLLVLDSPFLSEANGARYLVFEKLTQTQEIQHQPPAKSQRQTKFEEYLITEPKDRHQINLSESQGVELEDQFQKIVQGSQKVKLRSRILPQLQNDRETKTKDQLKAGVQNDREGEHQDRVNTSERKCRGGHLKHPSGTNARHEDQLANSVSGSQLIKMKDQLQSKARENQEVKSEDQDFNVAEDLDKLQHAARKNQIIKFEDKQQTEIGETRGTGISESDLVPSLWTRMKSDRTNEPRKTPSRRNSGSLKPQMSDIISRSFGRGFIGARQVLTEQLSKLDECTGGRLSGAKQAMTGGLGKLGRVASNWGGTRRPSNVGKVEGRTSPDVHHKASKPEGAGSPKVRQSRYGPPIRLFTDEQLAAMSQKYNTADSSSRRDGRANIPPKEGNAMYAEANQWRQLGNRDPDDGHKHVPVIVRTYPNSFISDQIPLDQQANFPPGEANAMFAEGTRRNQPGNRDPDDGHKHVPVIVPAHATSIRSDQIPFEKKARLKPGEANSVWAAVSEKSLPKSRKH